MTDLMPAERVSRGAAVLARALRPFVEQHPPAPADGGSWPAFYQALDRTNGRPPRQYSLDDPRFLLTVLTQRWRSFGSDLSMEVSGYARELRATLNSVAHEPHTISPTGAQRSLDTMRLLLESLGDREGAEQVTALAADERVVDEADEVPQVARRSPASTPGVSDIGPDVSAGAGDPEVPDVPSLGEEEPVPTAEATEAAGTVEAVDDRPDLPEGCRRLVLTTEQLTISAIYREAINYALVNNDISPLLELELCNTTTSPVVVEEVGLWLRVMDDDGLAGQRSLAETTIAAGERALFHGSDVEWSLDHRAFAALEEARVGELSLAVAVNGQQRRAAAPMRLLARDEWYARSIPELLAAFVTPNAPAVVEVLSAASDLLAENTGDPSLQGYQEGAERAVAIGQAIYEALAQREIRYVEPPASFESDGQKIRPVGRVLSERFGTCLDLATTYAAALEQAGLNPVIVRVKGHAFGGFLTEDRQLSEVALRDRRMIQNLVRSGIFVPVELTALTAGREVAFDAARQATARWWDDDMHQVRHLLDVAAAHRRVKPLPAVRIEGGEVVIEIEKPPATPLPRLGAVDGDAGPVGEWPSSRPARIERWRSSLLDLTLRNPLLKLKKTSGVVLDVPERALADFEDMVAEGDAITLRSGEDLTEISQAQGVRTASQLEDHALHQILLDERTVHVETTAKQHEGKLDRLRRQSKTVLEETGANNLFLTFGALAWRDKRGDDALAPLYLLPVKVAGRKGQRYTVRVEDGAEMLPNYCLIEKLRREQDLVIDELEHPPADESGIDIEAIFQRIRSVLTRHHLSFTVEPHVRLAILQFATLEMWRDISDNWEQLVENPVVKHLVETPTETFVDPVPEPQANDTDEATHYLPVAIDGSQLKAIDWSVSGRTFVLEGPPGTGKSQTITNMIADNLAAGRKVLFVADKQAALDVVRQRLDRVGLGPLCLDLHGRTQTMKGVRAQLSNAWDARVASNPQSFRTLRTRHHELVEALANYPRVLHEQGGAGLSVWTAEQRVLSLARELSDEEIAAAGRLTVPGGVVNGNVDLERARAWARKLDSALEKVRDRPEDHEWRLAGPLSDEPSQSDDVAAVEDLCRTVEGLSELLVRLLRASDDTDSWEAGCRWLEQVEAGEAIGPAEWEQIGTADWAQEAEALREATARFRDRFGPLLDAMTPQAHGADSQGWRDALSEARNKRMPWSRNKAVQGVHQGMLSLVKEPSMLHEEAMDRFLDDMDAMRQQVVGLNDHAARVLPRGTGWDGRDATALDRIDRTRKSVERLEAVRRGLAGSDEVLTEVYRDRSGTHRSSPASEHPSLANQVQQLIRCWDRVRTRLNVRDEDLRRWLDGQPLIEVLRAASPRWHQQAQTGRLTRLDRFRSVQTALQALDDLGFGDFVGQIRADKLPHGRLASLLELAVARLVLQERLETSALDVFRTDRRAERVWAYRRTSDEVRKRLVHELPAKLLRERGLDPDRPTPAQGALRREIQRKRGGSIRELVERHGEALLQLTPCLLMSPPSVARHLPAGAVDFDLVIFDEASQVKVADAIGAMGRARAAVIVGDTQQMPPTAMFAISDQDEEEESLTEAGATPRDQESILSEAVDSNVERLRLTWHYRSQDESLIAFSNRQYYKGDLASFPGPPEKRDGLGLSLRRVHGVFDGGRSGSRTNPQEAEAIVEEVTRRLKQDPAASIGVVTFNSQQRDLILDLLEQSTTRAVTQALDRERESLFVKNLENVQGDERDAILFSLAFSPDPETGRMRLNFGPLTTEGGERRLNVAITRARREVQLFTSFEPHDIDLTRTSSRGMQHLREYLLFADSAGDASRSGTAAETLDLYRDQVAHALEARGLQLWQGIGMSHFRVDLAVRERPGAPWMAVLLDGPDWASRPTVADRDAVPPAVLEDMGWAKIYALWLPSWLEDADRCADELYEAAHALAAPKQVAPVSSDVVDVEPERPQAPKAPSAAADEIPSAAEEFELIAKAQPVVSGEDSAPSETMGQLVYFSPASEDAVADVSVLSELNRRANRDRVAEQIRDVVRHEGPVEAGRLAHVVGARFGLSRVRESRRLAILGCAPADVTKQTGPLGTFYWPQDVDPAQYGRFRRTPADVSRGVSEIAPEEIGNAMLFVLSRDARMTKEDLIYETKELFGFSRAGRHIRERFEAVIDSLARRGRATLDGDWVAASEAR